MKVHLTPSQPEERDYKEIAAQLPGLDVCLRDKDGEAKMVPLTKIPHCGVGDLIQLKSPYALCPPIEEAADRML